MRPRRFIVPYLACQHKVGVHGHGRAISDEVRDGLHDIPGVLPPGEPGQDAELGGHVRHAAPQHPGGAPLRLLTQLLPHLRRHRTESDRSKVETCLGEDFMQMKLACCYKNVVFHFLIIFKMKYYLISVMVYNLMDHNYNGSTNLLIF